MSERRGAEPSSAAPGPGDCSVVIATLARPEPLERALASLAGCDPGPGEVVVVDGDAAATARPVVDRWRGRGLAVRHLGCEPGLTRQRNAGLRATAGAVVVFLDDDARVGSTTFADLAAAYEAGDVVGATGRVIEPESNRVGTKASPLRRLLPGGGREGGFTRYGYPRRLIELDRARDVSFMQGAFMTARRSAALATGFDESLAGYGLAEDEDFSCRLARRGRVRYLPDLVVHHDNAGFATRDRRAFNRQVVRNRAHLFRKNFAQTRVARSQFWGLVLLLAAHRAANRDWRGVQGLVEGSVETWRTKA